MNRDKQAPWEKSSQNCIVNCNSFYFRKVQYDIFYARHLATKLFYRLELKDKCIHALIYNYMCIAEQIMKSGYASVIWGFSFNGNLNFFHSYFFYKWIKTYNHIQS